MRSLFCGEAGQDSAITPHKNTEQCLMPFPAPSTHGHCKHAFNSRILPHRCQTIQPSKQVKCFLSKPSFPTSRQTDRVSQLDHDLPAIHTFFVPGQTAFLGPGSKDFSKYLSHSSPLAQFGSWNSIFSRYFHLLRLIFSKTAPSPPVGTVNHIALPPRPRLAN